MRDLICLPINGLCILFLFMVFIGMYFLSRSVMRDLNLVQSSSAVSSVFNVKSSCASVSSRLMGVIVCFSMADDLVW